MKSEDEVLAWYEDTIKQQEKDHYRQKKKVSVLSWMRLIIFSCIVIILFTSVGEEIKWAAGIFMVILFFIVLRFHLTNKDRLGQLTIILQLLKREKEILDGNIPEDAFPEYEEVEHPYAADMDIFGKRGIFGFFSRTVTRSASDYLANQFKFPGVNPEEIVKEQEANTELALKPDWRFNFLSRIAWHQQQKSTGDPDAEMWWKRYGQVRIKINQILLFVWPVFSVLSCFAYGFNFISGSILTFIILAGLAISGFYLKKLQPEFSLISSCAQEFKAKADLSSIILQEKWNSFFLSHLVANFEGKHNPITSFRELSKIVGAIDSRNNIFVGLIFNALFLWDLQCARRLNNWKFKHQDDWARWQEVLLKFEVRISAANFVFNNPNYLFPTPNLEPAAFDLENLGHPLLPAESRVNNNLSIQSDLRMVIITGANMAGKSTFLRSLGVNWIMASLGLPVAATRFNFGPASLYTSMRATDSLTDGKSYFFNELDRLKRIVNHLEKGNSTLVLLDEILRGTNSADQTQGSLGFLKKLLQQPAKVIVATHDLELCRLENDFPDKVKNYRFEVEVDGEELLFDYKLKQGICQTRNAEILLRKMGLTS